MFVKGNTQACLWMVRLDFHTSKLPCITSVLAIMYEQTFGKEPTY